MTDQTRNRLICSDYIDRLSNIVEDGKHKFHYSADREVINNGSMMLEFLNRLIETATKQRKQVKELYYIDSSDNDE